MFTINMWQGDCLSADAAQKHHVEVREHRTVVRFGPDVDGMLAWLATRFPKLTERPWRTDLLGYSDIPVAPDVFGGYASVGVIWPDAATVGREIASEAHARGLTVYLPDGPPEVGACVLCEGEAFLPHRYWEGVSRVAHEIERKVMALDPSFVRLDSIREP
jgi:hypothetical protein